MSAIAEAVPQPTPLPQMVPVGARESALNLTYRQAKALSSSDLVPKAYHNNVPNTMLAMQIADDMGVNPFTVMQNLNIIQGKPSWGASFLIATVNAKGRFDPLRFEIVGNDPYAKDYKVRCYAKDRESGVVCYGSWITWRLVDGEGWSGKPGSKWKTMPEQMFLYRAGAFWQRVYAPEASAGLPTTEEVQDISPGGYVTSYDNATNSQEGVEATKAALQALEAPATDTKPTREPERDPDTGELLPDDL